jgi:hypothetical protein
VDATASHQGPNSSTTENDHSRSAGHTEESESDEDELVEENAVDAAAREVSISPNFLHFVGLDRGTHPGLP